MRSYARLTPEARRISAAIAWQVGQKRLSVVGPDSPLARDPARDAARFLDRCLGELAREEARCRLLLGRLLTVFGRHFALTKLGFVRLSDYSRERLGISGSEADATARVARRLEGLPLLREAFLSGTISWTKVRLLSSVAKPETEVRWLALAGTRTVRELEKLVAEEGALPACDVTAVREDDDLEVDGEPRAHFRMRLPCFAWLLFRRVVELARTVAGEAGMPLWKAVDAITAEGLGAGPDPNSDDVDVERISPSRANARPPRGRLWLSTRRGRRRTGEAWKPRLASLAGGDVDLLTLLPGVARWLGVETDALRRLLPDAGGTPDAEEVDGLTPIALDARLRAVTSSLRTIDVRIGRALRFVSERRLFEEIRRYDLEDYVTERLGIGLRKARSLVALDRVSGETPALRAAYDEGSLSWVRAVVLMPVVLDGREASAWVERARRVTVRRLSDEVSWALERKVVEKAPVALPPPLGAARREARRSEGRRRSLPPSRSRAPSPSQAPLAGVSSQLALVAKLRVLGSRRRARPGPGSSLSRARGPPHHPSADPHRRDPHRRRRPDPHHHAARVPRNGSTEIALDPLEWIHAITSQIPDRRQRVVR